MSTLEIVAFVLGVASVILTVRQSLWCWPIGVLMVLCYAVIFYRARLYSDVALQGVYVVLQVYGFWYWLRGAPVGSGNVLTVRRLRFGYALGGTILAALLTIVLGTTMHRLTDADLPYWDALTTVLSLFAQVLLGRKVLESWLVWIVVDVISIGVYFAKELYLTAALYAIFLALAVTGFAAWRRSMRADASSPATVVLS